jgi:hypothetical protein
MTLEEQEMAPDPDAEGLAADPASAPYLLSFVQSLKGAPASALVALAVTGRFMSNRDLQLWTRCGKNQITFAMKSLVRIGWVAARTSRGPWVLARPIGILGSDECCQRIPFKGLSSSSESLNSSDRETILPSPRRRELLEAMAGFGIREPTASELAELPHMSLDYLRAHAEGARMLGLKVGSAIEAMRLGASPPLKPSPADRQAEAEEKIRRFREGS